jgi:adenine/guanine phosphoribosyltransferase-like PRPP-binding protein
MQAHEFWQRIETGETRAPEGAGVDHHAAVFDDGRLLRLPIRPLSDGRHALASLILNQASFEVVETIAADLARKLASQNIDIVVGLPTLGLTLASALAARLGHSRYVPLGTSRKFWYREDLSVPLSSITTPDQTKRLYIDPRMLPLLQDRRVALVDDVLSSGASITSALRLMSLCGVEPVAVGAAMLQSTRWRATLAALDPKWPARVFASLETPLLTRAQDGMWRAET